MRQRIQSVQLRWHFLSRGIIEPAARHSLSHATIAHSICTQFASGTQMHAFWGLEFFFWEENHLNGSSEITHCCIYTKIDRYIKMWGSFLCRCSAYWVWFYQILRMSRFFMQHEWLKESSFLILWQFFFREWNYESLAFPITLFLYGHDPSEES
jgi:hypothetical protein